MKTTTPIKIIKALLICSFPLFISVNNITAQTEKGQSIMTMGIGAGIYDFSFSAMYDYGLNSKFSLGLAYSKDFEYMRSTYCLRVLGHSNNDLLKKIKMDAYTGIRAGIGYRKRYPDLDDIYYLPDGKFFTAQVLIGLRKNFCYNLLGINAEIALGAPYIYSLGINYNFLNTKSAFRSAKDDYYRELQSPVRKNIFKVNLYRLMAFALESGSYEFSYEHYISNRFSTQLSVAFVNNSFDSFNGSYDTSTKDSIRKARFKTQSVGGSAALRYYFQSVNKSFPKGLYLSAGYKFQNANVKVIDLHMVPDSINYNHSGKIKQNAFEFTIGRQWLLINNTLSIDVFAGIRICKNNEEVRFQDAFANNESFKARFGTKTIAEIYQNPALIGLNIGYAF
jgi:hypothetical protein